ncbi:MAG: NAD+ synthase [Desulfovibrio sp.]|uniref:NAD+ synthase n=1 Tax=Desulfovibrio sp. 7SRBS1 TaxID=3378064 RepID=UPI003B3F8503
MNIALLQLNPLVGDLRGNAELVLEAVRQAAQRGADLCITPEMVLTGYPARDLLLYEAFIRKCDQVAQDLARAIHDEMPDGPALLLGSVAFAGSRGCAENNGDSALSAPGKPLHNALLLLRNGRVERVFGKTLLPAYDVFDEERYFEPFPEPGVFDLNGTRIGVSICEDIWNDKEFWQAQNYAVDPVDALMRQNPDILVNASASPFCVGKQAVREQMLSSIAARRGVPLVYVNQCGGNDELIFDGRSSVFAADGTLTARACAFENDLLCVDVAADKNAPAPAPAQAGSIADDDFSAESEIWRALVTGTRDYVRKSGFSKAVVGLSGGIDSALTAAVAAHALGASNVTGVLMPSPYSSQGSLDDAYALVNNLGIQSFTLPIAPLMQGFEQVLAEPFAGRDPDVTEENIQSRIRGNLLMAMSNKHGSLLLTTGNKSELSVGYCTIYGDMCGALGVIADVPKTMVFSLCRWLNSTMGPHIPEATISKPPSAELRPDQKDQDSLPDYDTLDAVLHLFIEKKQSRDEIVAAGHAPQIVDRVLGLVKRAEFKRRQAPPGLKTTSRAFGTGWRMPLACK